MQNLEEIKKQINKLDGTSRFLGRKEIKELPSILWEDELIEKLVQGIYENKVGILVATNKRLIFIDKGLIYGLRVEDFSYDKISSIQCETGLFFGKIIIFSSGNKAEIRQVGKNLARGFSDFVRARITNTKDHKIINDLKDDKFLQLEKIAELKERGILTDEEFTIQKKKILE